MDGVSGTTSAAQAHIRVEVMPRIAVTAPQQVKTNDPAVEVVATKTLSNGVQVIIYQPSHK